MSFLKVEAQLHPKMTKTDLIGYDEFVNKCLFDQNSPYFSKFSDYLSFHPFVGKVFNYDSHPPGFLLSKLKP